MEEDSGEDMDAVVDQAKHALEAAMMGDDDQDDVCQDMDAAVDQAKHALEAALMGDDDQDDVGQDMDAVVDQAKHALETDLMGDNGKHDVGQDLDALQMKALCCFPMLEQAQSAMEAALSADDQIDACQAQSMNASPLGPAGGKSHVSPVKTPPVAPAGPHPARPLRPFRKPDSAAGQQKDERPLSNTLEPKTPRSAASSTADLVESLEPLQYSSTVEWQQRTSDSLQDAKALIRQASSLFEAHMAEAARGPKKSAASSNVGLVRATLQKRLGITNELIQGLAIRAEGVEATIRQAGECLFELKRAVKEQNSPLSVCDQRLKLRRGRPEQELVRDIGQQALDDQRLTILHYRRLLTEHVESAKERLLVLESIKDRLYEDLQRRRHALRLDRTLRMSQQGGQASSSKSVPGKTRSQLDKTGDSLALGQDLRLPPLSARSGKVSGLEATPEDSGAGGMLGRTLNLQELSSEDEVPAKKRPEGQPRTANTFARREAEGEEQTKSFGMLADAAARQEDARRQIEESMNLVLTSRIDCARATELVQRELSMRVKETAHFKKQLEAQLFETDQALQLTGISFTTVRRELEASEIPLRAALDMQLMSKRGRKGRLKEDGQEAGIRELS
ncbi:unnamed protein product [Polarella glacialis]|uniref:Uncharacterized protein n=1 Tax=Polarella glacialis TaxID=89957 RepID=A0A813HI32_POLGL|nr:unnamed protein product [Polarella glacialis]